MKLDFENADGEAIKTVTALDGALVIPPEGTYGIRIRGEG